MVFPSSKAKEGMSVTTKMCEYFENLMKPLVTNESLEELPSSIKRLEEKIQSAKKVVTMKTARGLIKIILLCHVFCYRDCSIYYIFRKVQLF